MLASLYLFIHDILDVEHSLQHLIVSKSGHEVFSIFENSEISQMNKNHRHFDKNFKMGNFKKSFGFPLNIISKYISSKYF